MQRSDLNTERKGLRNPDGKGEYDLLLEQAIRIGEKHQSQAKDFVPRMYAILTQVEGLVPAQAAEKIYSDLKKVWEKDTIRRLMPPEAKNQIARQRQAQSRLALRLNKAGSILRQIDSGKDASQVELLKRENEKLTKKAEELTEINRMQLGRIMQLKKEASKRPMVGGDSDSSREQVMEMATTTEILLPPYLFMKAFTMMRNCMKPLVLKVEGKEVVDIERKDQL